MFKINTTLLNLVRTSGLLLSLAIMSFFYIATAQAGQVTLAWNANTESTLVGYNVYYRTASTTYPSSPVAVVPKPTTTSTVNLPDGTYYFAVKAYDNAGESGFSNEVSTTISSTTTVAYTFATQPSGLTLSYGGVSRVTPFTVDAPINSQQQISAPATQQNYNFSSWSDGGGATHTITIGTSPQTVTATYVAAVAAPTANFSASPASGPGPLLVTFTDTSTGSIASRSWNFGDGSSPIVTTTAQTFVRSYAYGTYTVSLTLKDSTGTALSTKTQTITATAVQPTANFSATTTSALLTVKLSNSSTGTVTGWSWNFGDGGTSTAQDPPDYTYKAAGTYTISLTATGPAGTTPNTKTQTITVTAASAGSGLVAAYNFEEASGTVVVDASGKGNHGAITEATRTSSGKYGQALSFDGVNDWVTVNDSASLDLTTGMTLEAWVYPTSSMSGWHTVLFKEQANGAVYYLDANSDSNQPATGLFIGSEQILWGGPWLTANTWTHLATTYDGTTQWLYVNGSEVANRAQSGGIQVSNGVLRIGGNSIWGEFFKGRIDEVRIYNRALSVSQIQTDMNNAVTTTSPAKLLLGDQAIGQMTDSKPQGTAEAFKKTAAVTGTGMVTSLSVYVNAGSTSTQLVAGLYKDNRGHPDQLLAQGSLSNPKADAWNKILLPATSVTAGSTYWIAILSPTGVLQFRDKVGGAAQPCETSAQTTLTTLPSTWTTGTVYADGPLSGYGAGY